MRRITAAPSSSGTWGSAKRKVNMYGSPNRTITLETLLDRLDRHPNVGLAVCQSWIVDQDSKPLGNYRDLLENQNHSLHWREDYVNAGHDECKNHLFWHNTILNASAVLWRRECLERAGGTPTHRGGSQGVTSTR